MLEQLKMSIHRFQFYSERQGLSFNYWVQQLKDKEVPL